MANNAIRGLDLGYRTKRQTISKKLSSTTREAIKLMPI